MKFLTAWVVLFVCAAGTVLAQQLAPNAPKDQPVGATMDRLAEFEKAMAPSIAEAKKTYPDARERYLKGLPPKHHFFVTIRLKDPDGRFEQVFIYVLSMDQEKKTITGRISSQLDVVRTYSVRQVIVFPESEVIDWTISRPDGTEEGNFVGKFLDEYQKPKG